MKVEEKALQRGDLVRMGGGLHSTAPIGIVLKVVPPYRGDEYHRVVVYWDYNKTTTWQSHYRLERVV